MRFQFKSISLIAMSSFYLGLYEKVLLHLLVNFTKIILKMADSKVKQKQL